MNEILKKAQEVLQQMSDIINKTLEEEIEQLKNLEEKAMTIINNSVTEVQNAMSELSKQSEEMKKHVENTESKIVEIQTGIRNKLVECYKKHYDPLDTLRAERAKIHKSASQLKYEAQKMMEKCVKVSDPVQCFQQSLADLAKKAKEVAKKFEAHIKKEAEITLKIVKSVHECDERAITEAKKKYSKLIEDVKKCAK